MLYEIIRPALFQLDPETAHGLTLSGLRMLDGLGTINPLRQNPQGQKRTVMGLDFPNPVGLAAGLDKNGEYIDGLAALGFGFIEIGTVTPKPQPGNEKPRLFRLPEAEAIINRMGFNNRGVDYLLGQVSTARYRGILGINIGKNKDTPLEEALTDYLTGLRKVYTAASYITVNISSPNTPGLRSLQAGETLDQLLAGLMAGRAQLAIRHHRMVPLAVKVAPDLDIPEIEAIADSLVRQGVDAVIATNTTSGRAGVGHLPHGTESGGLSGRPLMEISTAVVGQFARHLQGKLPVIASGGILSTDDAQRKLDAGAELVQVYSGLIYRGPRLVRELVQGLP